MTIWTATRTREIIVNTTPVGMYPNTRQCRRRSAAASRSCEGVLDIVYNPARTALLLQAESARHPVRERTLHARGAGQAQLRGVHRYGDRRRGDPAHPTVCCGRRWKTSSSSACPAAARAPSRRCSPSGWAARCSTATRRSCETAGHVHPGDLRRRVARRPSARGRRPRSPSSASARARSLATGGGSICREENYPLLHQNGDDLLACSAHLERLPPQDGRPVSQAQRPRRRSTRSVTPLYARFADAIIDNNGTPEDDGARKFWRCSA